MKKLNTLLVASAMLLTSLAATSCNGSQITIGILQPVEHSALSAAREGFIQALADGGYVDGKNVKIVYENANGSESDQNTLAKSLVGKSKLLLGIGTGATQSLHAAQIENGRNDPLLFTAVTDPVSAELVSSMKNHGGNITGTSDANPVESQIDLIKDCLPDVVSPKVGIIYTSSEINSKVQADQAKAEAESQGMSVVIKTCTDSSDIKTTATALCGTESVDALYIPTDNNIAANMPIIKTVVDEFHTLTVCGEEGMLTSGGHITYSVNYSLLGKRTGEMAVSILKGEKSAGDIDCETMLDPEYLSKVYSSSNLADSSVTIPESVLANFEDISK